MRRFGLGFRVLANGHLVRKSRFFIVIPAVLAAVLATGACGSLNSAKRDSLNHYPSRSENGDIAGIINRDLQGGKPNSLGSLHKQTSYVPRPQFDIPFTRNAKVDQWIQIFTTTLRDKYTLWLSRLGRYGIYMEDVLASHGLPRDILYLSMIESGLNLNAYSHANAAGPWQFIKSTGRLYGLQVNEWVDDRRDLVKATDAGARHLKDLYALYGDWYLAFGAYNAGAGKINRAIRTTGSRDFWTISRHRHAIRAETKDYVPKILAAAYVAKNYKKFGFSEDLFMPALDFETVQVDGGVSIDVLARCAGTDPDWMTQLNAEFHRGMTPPGGMHAIRIPAESAHSFGKAYAALSPEEKFRATPKALGTGYDYYRVKRKDTLGRIAKRHGVSTRELVAANNLKNQKIHAGQMLKIPSRAKAQPAGQYAAYPSAETKSEKTLHRVRRGESLGKIASRYGVSLADLRAWNPSLKRDRVYAGQYLAVRRTETPVSNPAAPTGGIVGIIATNSGPEPTSSPENAVSAPASTPEAPEASASPELENAPVIAESTPSAAPSAAVPPVVVAPPEAADPTPIHTVHRVRRGETLWKIANRYGVSIAELRSWNSALKNNKIYVGQRLTVAKKSIALPVAQEAESTAVATATSPDHNAIPAEAGTPAVSAPATTLYRVRSGDTLWSIAKDNRVSIDTLKSLNTDKIGRKNRIKAGMMLAIPATSAEL